MTAASQVQGYYEPSLSIVVLPRCPRCEHPHPMAVASDARDVSTCPGCGGPAASPHEPVEVEATFTGDAQ